MDHAVAIRDQREWRDSNMQNFLNLEREPPQTQPVRLLIIMKIGYVHNVLQLHRRQIKNIQLRTILILEFARIVKETTPKNHPSAIMCFNYTVDK